MKKLFTVKDFAQKQLFLVRWPLEAKPLSLGQIWRQLSVSKFNSLSNDVFGFVLAIIVPEIMEVFRSNVRHSRKIENLAIFWPWGPQFWPWRKIDWNSFVIIFDELWNVFFRFSLRPTGAETDGGVRPPPPPKVVENLECQWVAG